MRNEQLKRKIEGHHLTVIFCDETFIQKKKDVCIKIPGHQNIRLNGRK